MTTFAYTALGRDGKRTNGTLAADSRADALAMVMQKGLHPVKIDEDKAKAKSSVLQYAGSETPAQPPRSGRVPPRAVENFTRELANLLSGGVPLARALHLLRREASKPAARFVWAQIHADVVGGMPLADAMAKWPKTFSSVYIAMVRAGEAGGFLDVVLMQIADFRTREADLKGKVKGAMVYPCVLATLAVGVLIFLMTFFIPRFSGIFKEFGGDLPALTKFIVAVSNIVSSRYGIGVLVAVVVGVILFRQYIKTDLGRRKMEQVLLSLPVLGQVIAHFALVRFARMLGTLVGAGVSLVASLKVAREAIGNQTLADTVLHGIEEVQRGEPLSKALGSSPKLFPPSVVETIAVAEETGRLDKELVRLAGAYESDLDRQLRLLVSIVEPLMLFVMAGIIGTVVIGMLLPVFNLQDMIK